MEPLIEFRRVAIIGHGLIGGSIELALRGLDDPPLITALDRGDSLDAVDGADLIILAASVSQNIQILSQLGACLSGEAVITDTGSTKRTLHAAATALPSRLRFIGGHPMAGAAGSGLAAARGDLFSGRPWILTPASGATPPLAELFAFVSALGATPCVMSPDEHDRLVAYVSHLPQLVVSALMHTVGTETGDQALSLAGTGLRDSARLSASPPAMWRDIVASNRDHVNAALDDLIHSLRRMRDDEGTDALAEVFESASHWKAHLDKSSPP
ncbi:MAG TPA: prephenate dehydrogenase/arogenate dehydrogenase family protein [Vicinamibacterales bacterium]|nr:prephenate dehydrogenase/arogenate dehydrogenase family protein [Vicinamibacterales bacterium]